MTAPSVEFELPGARATLAWGAALAHALQAPAVIWLRGDLGAGKTTLARGVIQKFDPTARVKSPTYPLIETYELAVFTLHHIDLYRVRDPAELEPLGLREFAADVLLIEWPERGADATPAADLEVSLRHTEEENRVLLASPRSSAGGRLLGQLQQFLQRTDYE